jgi:hypothetical protein
VLVKIRDSEDETAYLKEEVAVYLTWIDELPLIEDPQPEAGKPKE